MREKNDVDDQATAELLAALDELYPLPDDDRRVERAGRTAAAVKRWMTRALDSLGADVLSRLTSGQAAHASLVQEMETKIAEWRDYARKQREQGAERDEIAGVHYCQQRAMVATECANELAALLRRSTSKEPNPCPTCGAFLWGDTRPCWNCLRRSAAPGTEQS